MPTPLLPIDLSNAGVGSIGMIDLTNCAPSSNPYYTNVTATLQIYNESGAGLRMTGKNTGIAFDLPAGAWNNVAVPVGETEIDYVVLYVLASAPVHTLLITYYAPNEGVPRPAALGNSPIGLSTNVPINATATAVANDGNASGTEFIEASIGGVKHMSGLNDGLIKLLRDSTSANQDVLEFVDIKVGGKDYQFLLLSTGGIRLLNVTDNVVIMDWLPTGALNISGTAIQTNAGGNIFCTGVKLTNLAGGVYTGQTGQGVQAWSKFTGTTTGTYSHGLGITPTHVDPEQHAVGSSSFGWDSETSTQVHITNFNGAAFTAMAYNI